MLFAYSRRCVMDDIRFNMGLSPVISSVGYISVMRKENFSFSYKKGKDKFTFVFVKRGKMKYYFPKSGETFFISEGEMFYFPRYVPYETTYMENNTTIKTLTFDIEGEELPSYMSAVPEKKKSGEYTAVFDSITSLNMRSTLFLAAKTYELLYLMQSRKNALPKNYKKIFSAVDEICRKYNENKKISYYADMCNMSESNFRKLFKEGTGKSPIEYRNLIRISEAKKLIESGEFTVSEAAYYVGFNNMSFFYKLYSCAD